MKEKKCNKCKKVKLLSEFYKDKGNRDGLRSDCKECSNERVKKYHRTEEGLLTQIYSNQKQNSKARGHKPPNYTKEELGVWCFAQKIWDKLFGNWKKSGHKKELIPSCDRDDDYKPYTLDNIKLKTWEENNAKGHKDIREGRNNKVNRAILQYTKDGVFVKEHYSINQAGRTIGINFKDICSCCQGKRKSAGGFIWKYKN